MSKTPDLKIPLSQFASTPSVAIATSSLLIRKPELADAQLTEKEWQDALDADQATPTDPHLLDKAAAEAPEVPA